MAEHPDQRVAVPAIQALDALCKDPTVQGVLGKVIRQSGNENVHKTAMSVAYSEEALQEVEPSSLRSQLIFADLETQEAALFTTSALEEHAQSLLEFCRTDPQRRIVTDEILPALDRLKRLFVEEGADEVEIVGLRARAASLIATTASLAREVAVGIGAAAPKIYATIELAEKLADYGDQIQIP